MTAQIPDHVTYQQQQYAIAGVHGDGLFSPESLGLQPVMMSTACWRGYVADYAVIDERLLLVGLTIRTNDDAYPPIDGMQPQGRVTLGGMRYEGLTIPVVFSGSLLIGRDFIRETYVHMGFHKPSQYRRVLELICVDGQVLEVIDRSEETAEERAEKRFEQRLWAAARGEEPGQRMRNIAHIDKPGLLRWIERRFSLNNDSDEDDTIDITGKN